MEGMDIIMKDSKYREQGHRFGYWLGMMIVNGGIWYSIFTNGFFITLIWLVIIAGIIGIIFKIKEMRV